MLKVPRLMPSTANGNVAKCGKKANFHTGFDGDKLVSKFPLLLPPTLLLTMMS